MTLSACILVFISALTHICWNFLGKSVCSNTKSFAIASFLVIIIFSPILIFYKNNIKDILSLWYLILISGFFLCLSYWGILMAYRFGDLSFVYPLKNAQPIIITTIFSFIIGKGSSISFIAIFGFIFIFLGCLCLPIKSYSDINIRKYFNKGSIYAFLAACGSAFYSIIDSNALNKLHNTLNISNLNIAIIYIPFLYLACALFLFGFMFVDNKILGKNTFNIQVNFKLLPIISICLCLTYLLIFMAYSYANNVSYVVAFRQIGMPLSILVGYFILGEKIYLGKIIGGLLIILGLVITSLF